MSHQPSAISQEPSSISYELSAMSRLSLGYPLKYPIPTSWQEFRSLLGGSSCGIQ